MGGLFSRSCNACCERDGWREARGEVVVPRMCSAKLERWAEGRCGRIGELILSTGGGERPMEDTELLRDCSGDGAVGVSLLPSPAIVEAGEGRWEA